MGYWDSLEKIRNADYRTCSDEERLRISLDVVHLCSFACAGLVLQPLPGLEQTVVPLQGMMVLTVAHVFGQELSRKKSMEILMDIARITGASIISRQVLSTVSKLIFPVVGGLINAPYTFSMTWAVGHAAVYYMKAGGKVNEDKMREIFEEEKKRSKSHYNPETAKASRPTAEDAEKIDKA
jgi:uncharacterized protein (DUF697 family)